MSINSERLLKVKPKSSGQLSPCMNFIFPFEEYMQFLHVCLANCARHLRIERSLSIFVLYRIKGSVVQRKLKV